MRFGQKGNDFWNGPLQMKDGTIDQPTCSRYDRFYPISRVEVERHIRAQIENDDDYVIPQSILEWPGNGAAGESMYLAPYQTWPGNDPTVYRPQLGDYPYYDFDNLLCPWTETNKEKAKKLPWSESADGKNPSPTGLYPNNEALPMPPERVWTRQQRDFEFRDNMMIYADHVLKGDETIFWFLNDRGGPHTESKSNRSIGLEIRVQAFAFATNDELNKMTFYSYEIINRGRNTLKNTYFSQWVDPDLGYANDDYVGCDVNRGMGYCYNGVEIDGNGQFWAYGANPPAVGVDFFQGPYIDPDGSDNPKFHKELADATGSEAQREYCRLFVDYLFEQWGEDGPKNLSEPHPTKTIVVTHDDGTKDTLPLRFNNQFAINGVNFGDGIVDNERFGMRRFVYHNNDGSDKGDPNTASGFYNYLRGIWKNGQRMTYGGDGLENKNTAKCDFMFPRGTDYCNWGTRGELPEGQGPANLYGRGGRTGNWSEESPNGVGSKRNPPGDRRFMQSAGPFTLRQGACNYITVGIPWARATQGGVQASIALLIVADDRCQALFENCFKVLDGPDAPALTIREYDQKLILLLSNSAAGNNELEDYKEMDPTIPEYRIDMIQHRIDSMIVKISDSLIVNIDGIETVIYYTKDTVIRFGGDTTVFSTTFDTVFYDRYYRFEGYQIFQVAGPDVGANDLDNPSLARIIRQYDIVNFDKSGNPVGRLINWEFDESLQVPVPREKVNGANLGIEHSFEVIQDAFATGNRQLVNYKTYYFIAIAYAYNEFAPFYIDDADPLGLVGQKLPYLRGRKTAEGRSVTAIPAIPHPPHVHGGVLTLNSDYGSIPNIIRVDGQGNGGVPLELTKETIDYIVRGGDKDATGKSTYRAVELKYEKNAGPLNIKVIDPLRVKPYDYTIVIRDSIINNTAAELSNEAYWILTIDPSINDEELIEAGLKDNNGNAMRVFTSQTTIGQRYEQIIFPLGISIGITNIDFAITQPDVVAAWERIMGDTTSIIKYNEYKAKLHYAQSRKIDLPQGDIVFERPANQWITGLTSDITDVPSNWIRSGNRLKGPWQSRVGGLKVVEGDYEQFRLEDAFFLSKWLTFTTDAQHNIVWTLPDRAFKDYTGEFRTLCNGTWAPYVLASPYDGGPQAKYITPDENTFPRPNATGTSTIPASEPVPAYYRFQDIQIPTRQPGYSQAMTNLYSVDVVLTPDREKWTRCVVLESSSDRTKSIGGAYKNEPRKSISVDQDGNPTPDATDGFGPTGNQGMGWFPGYAVNLETGERLNIMFAENSDTTLAKFGNLVNGSDMIFNPTHVYALAVKDIDTLNIPFIRAGTPIPQWQYDLLYEDIQINQQIRLIDIGIERIWGGMHYVYICNSAGNTSGLYFNSDGLFGGVAKPNDSPANPNPNHIGYHFPENDFLNNAKRNFNLMDTLIRTISGGNSAPSVAYECFIDPTTKKYPTYECPPYDQGEWLVQKFNQFLDPRHPTRPRVPLTQIWERNTKMQLFNNVMYTHIPMRPEDPGLWDQWGKSEVTYKIRVTRPYMRYISRWYENPAQRQYTVPADLDHLGYPVYKVSTRELAPTFNDTRIYQSVLDNINIVPNPYYGASLYEGNALETMVKIINLPTGLKNNAPVTINIFTVSGILVRTLTKGDTETSFVNWDLKNFANIPIAGGVYIIHVNVPGVGERMLKFFCTMRPTDLNTF